MKSFYLLLLYLIIIVTGCKKDSTTILRNVEFSLKSPNAYINQAVSFTIANTSGISYAWDFGDGTTQTTTTSATHTYTKSGIFTVNVTSTSLSFSKKIRVYPGTCSFQIKNSFTRMFGAPTVDIYDNNAKALIPAQITLKGLAAGAVSDTIFVNLPVLNYNPNITLGLNFTNANNKSIGFSSASFATAAGHTLYEINGSLSGTYYYSTAVGSFISGSNTLTYTDTVN